MTTTAFNSVGSTTWTCPAGITAVDVVVVGGGGAGGCGGQYIGGGGQAPSANTKSKVTVVPDQTYNLYVGAGGPTNSTFAADGTAGSASILYIGTAPYIVGAGAGGGNGGHDNNTGIQDGGNGPGSGVGGAAEAGGAGASGGSCQYPYAGGAAGTGGASGGGGGGGNISWGCAVGNGGAGGHGYITISYTAASAAFSGTPLSGDKPLAVQFTGPASQTTYAWDFGDGATATTQSPSHNYTTAAKRTVILATTNAFGFASKTEVDYITVLFKARMHSAMMQSDGLRFT